jgi:hypothetical protein
MAAAGAAPADVFFVERRLAGEQAVHQDAGGQHVSSAAARWLRSVKVSGPSDAAAAAVSWLAIRPPRPGRPHAPGLCR